MSVYLYHIRKTGGRSIINAFLRYLSTDDPKIHYRHVCKKHSENIGGKLYVGWDPRKLNTGNYYFAHSHEPFYKLKIPNNVTTITCLRDPVSRLQSYYKFLTDIKRKGPSNVHYKSAQMRQWDEEPEKFLEKVSPQNALEQLWMFSAQMNIDEAVSRIKTCEHILQTETLEVDIRRLGDNLGIKLALQHDGASDSRIKFSERFNEQARTLLAPEYRFLHDVAAIFA